jgi:hypothetical protein
MRAVFVFAVLVVQIQVAVAQTLDCIAPLRPMLTVELLFGRGAAGLRVSETAWTQFLAREVTPRFPDGLTVFDASGQWRNAQGGAVLRERSKVVMIIAPEQPPVQERLDAITAAYKKRFQQQSVGIVIRPVCASF